RIRVNARLFPVSGAIYPASYDPRRLAFFDGIGAEGWLGKTTQMAGECHPPGALAEARAWLRGRLLADVPGAAGGILVGVSTGWRGDIAGDDAHAMRNAGLGHLLAISGLHVGLVVGLVLVALRAGLALVPWVALRFPIHKWAAAAGLLAGIGYLAFSGGSVPTQRAMIMLGLVLIALLLDRVELSMRPVAWAAVIVLAAAPDAILTPSFQLSFAAVIGLVAVFETWRRHRRRQGVSDRRLPWAARYVLGVAATTVVATLATMPFAAFHFHRIALLGLFANLIAVPVFAFWVMPALLAGLLLAPLGLETWLWQAAGAGVDLILAVAYALGNAEGAVGRVGVVPVWGIGCAVLGGLWWAIWQERWRWWGVPLVLAGLAAPLTARPPDAIVSRDLLAVSDRQGGYWMRGRGGFVRERWLDETAARERPWPDGREAGAPGVAFACDGRACRLTTPDGTLALVEDPDAAGDCRTATYGIARYKLPGCAWWAGWDETVVLSLREGRAERIGSREPARPWLAP
ncbi:MAG: ComEC/Rec2 family competence protein, partial [Alphaproteobacteria bacterium]|nr:ComEC/Rec2 family competence protein [Alphaproteobacteria bacterium]